MNILLFDRWDLEEVEIKDPGLQQYISLRPVIWPHSSGRFQDRRFKKSEMNVVERFINKLMRPGRNTGKKHKVTTSLRAAFEIIHLSTEQNPVQTLVDAIKHSAPREETTRVTYGGIAQHQAVDVSPLRRVDLALRFLTEGVKTASFGNVKSLEEAIADELIAAANNDSKSSAVRKKQEIERIALSAR